MVQIKALALLGSLAAIAAAYPEPCIDDKTATSLVERFNSLYNNMVPEVAKEILTENFEEFSDSDNSSEGNGAVCYSH